VGGWPTLLIFLANDRKNRGITTTEKMFLDKEVYG